MRQKVSRLRAPLISIPSIHPAALAITAAGLLSLVVPIAEASGPPVGTNGWTADVAANPVFTDNFSGTALDTTKWNYRTDQWKPHMKSAQRPANVSVNNGLIITLLKQDTPNVQTSNGTITQHYTGGGIVSKQAFRYGYYETSAQINSTPGWHSSFWLQAGDGSNTYTTARRTEIDGFEIDSAALTDIRHNVIEWYPPFKSTPELTSGVYQYPNFTGGANFSTGYHTYGIDWEEDSVSYYVDGNLMKTLAYEPGSDTHDPVNIWLSDVATQWPTAATDQIKWAYASYWQKDYYVDYNNAGTGYAEVTGTWYTSSLPGWTKGYVSRNATCNVAGNVATWTPTILNAGNYNVYYYNIVNANSDSNMSLNVAGQTTMVNGTAGTSGWVQLTAAPIAVPAGKATTVTLTSSGSGCARAENVKFVRAN
ncbi:family 16 glycosylhydrolase [Paraburkholderia agricolaris]|uniref:Family 16 glycosylhydrolase n=1 Tax=Paraburkholderia agricolaris TaxID=2152888 RepID=A0ABW8ZWM3_9BURK